MNYIDDEYQQIYSFQQAGGDPSGACIADINNDGTNELIISWAYSSADGVYVYHWDGSTLTQLTYLSGYGINFIFDVYTCDYDADGQLELVVSNAPWGASNYYVIGFDWQDDHFVPHGNWACPNGNGGETCMVSSGDVNNDGQLEIIADVSYGTSYTYGTWALKWNSGTGTFDGTNVWSNYGSNTVYGDSVGDINGDGIPEIGIGCYGGTCTAWLFQWDGSSYQNVWQMIWPGGQPIIESVDIGDADNDGHNEFCVGGGPVHIIGWDGSQYVIEATFSEPTGMEAGMNVGDFDSDGLNEVKACEILSSTGYEFIWKNANDIIPPVTTCTLTGEQSGGVYISNVTVTLTATDAGSGVNYTRYALDDGPWTTYSGAFVVTANGDHLVKFYSVDYKGNQEAEKNASFTIRHPLTFDITLKGGFGVSMTVKNTGSAQATMIPWNITLTGGHIILGKQISGTKLSLNPGEEFTVKLTVLGFGKPTISAVAGDTQITASAHVFLFFVWGIS
jgi:hypothetical protein